MKTDIRLYYGPETDPVELYKVKVYFERKKFAVQYMNYNTTDAAAKAVVSLNGMAFHILFEKGVAIKDFSSPVVTCGDTETWISAGIPGPAPTSEVYIGYNEILTAIQ